MHVTQKGIAALSTFNIALLAAFAAAPLFTLPVGGLLLAQSKSPAGAQPAAGNDAPSSESPPEPSSGADTPQPPPPPDSVAPDQLSDAERIARLKRLIKEESDRLADSRHKVEDPKGEYAKAEQEFTRLDDELRKSRAGLEKLRTDGTPQQVADAQKALDELMKKWEQARTRFDLAITERKTLQAQIQVLEKKIAQDQRELQTLMGQTPPPAAPGTPPTTASSTTAPSTTAPSTTVPSTSAPGTAAPPASAPTAGAPSAPPPTATAPGSGSPPAAAEAPSTAENAAPKSSADEEAPPSEAVSAARQKVEQTAQDIAQAEQRRDSLRDGLEQTDELIEKQKQLLATRRQISQNAWKNLTELNTQLNGRIERGDLNGLSELSRSVHAAEQRYDEARQESAKTAEALSDLEQSREDLQRQIAAAEDRIAELQTQARWTWLEALSVEVGDWFKSHGLRLLLIVVGFVVLRLVIDWASERLIARRLKSKRVSPLEINRRTRTLFGVMRNAANVFLSIALILLVVAEINPDWLTPLLASMTVIGIAIGLGTQNLVRDYFYGFVMLLENQYTVDDVVRIGDISGLVEHVTLRMTVLRDLEGVVHFIPHGQITTVSNLTHGWSRATFDIGVAYKEDVDHVMSVLIDLGHELREDREFGPMIINDLEMLGVDAFADSAVVIKFIVKTRPLQQWAVKREMLRRIKKRFDELGIEIPFPHRTIYHRHEQDALQHERMLETGA